MMKIYYQLIENSGHTVRYASPNRQVVATHGYPIALEIYGASRTRAYVLADTLAFFAAQYGKNIKLVNIDETEKE